MTVPYWYKVIYAWFNPSSVEQHEWCQNQIELADLAQREAIQNAIPR